MIAAEHRLLVVIVDCRLPGADIAQCLFQRIEERNHVKGGRAKVPAASGVKSSTAVTAVILMGPKT